MLPDLSRVIGAYRADFRALYRLDLAADQTTFLDLAPWCGSYQGAVAALYESSEARERERADGGRSTGPTSRENDPAAEALRKARARPLRHRLAPDQARKARGKAA